MLVFLKTANQGRYYRTLSKRENVTKSLCEADWFYPSTYLRKKHLNFLKFEIFNVNVICVTKS